MKIKLYILLLFLILAGKLLSQIKVQFRDTTLANASGSWLASPAHTNETLDTTLYFVHPSNLLSPYSTTTPCGHTDSIKFILINEGSRYKLMVFDESGENHYELEDALRTKIPITFSCGENVARLTNYQVQKSKGDDFLYFFNYEKLVGEFNVDNQTCQINISPYVGNWHLSYSLRGQSNTSFRVGDVFTFNNKSFILTEFNYFDRTVTCREVKDQSLSSFGFSEGKTLENFPHLIDTINQNEQFGRSIESENSAYLLHFWGQWCGPCIDRIEADERLFTRINPNKVNIVNIAALIRSSDKSATLDVIQANEIGHYHILDNTSLLINPLRIESYPTYLLINQEGVILHKSNLYTPQEIQRFLSTLRENGYYQ